MARTVVRRAGSARWNERRLASTLVTGSPGGRAGHRLALSLPAHGGASTRQRFRIAPVRVRSISTSCAVSGGRRLLRHPRLDRLHQREPSRRSESGVSVNLHPGPPCSGRQEPRASWRARMSFRRSQHVAESRAKDLVRPISKSTWPGLGATGRATEADPFRCPRLVPLRPAMTSVPIRAYRKVDPVWTVAGRYWALRAASARIASYRCISGHTAGPGP